MIILIISTVIICLVSIFAILIIRDMRYYRNLYRKEFVEFVKEKYKKSILINESPKEIKINLHGQELYLDPQRIYYLLSSIDLKNKDEKDKAFKQLTDEMISNKNL